MSKIQINRVLAINTISTQNMELDFARFTTMMGYDTKHTITVFHLDGSKKVLNELFRILKDLAKISFNDNKKCTKIIGFFDKKTSKLNFSISVLVLGISSLFGFSCAFCGRSKVIQDVKLTFPWNPFRILLKITEIIKTYWLCFFSKIRGELKGFNKLHTPLNMMYEAQGMRMLKYGAWGYDYDDDFGNSLRKQFYLQWLSYGWIQNFLGQRYFSFFSAIMFLFSIFVSSIIIHNYIIGLILAVIIPFSPYFSFSFLTYTRPQIIVWFLAIPAFISVINGNVWMVAVILILISYLTFTGTFFIGLAVFSLIIFRNSYSMLFSFVPLAIKLGVDAIPALKSGYLRKTAFIIGCIGSSDKRCMDYKKEMQAFGIFKLPNQLLIGIILIILIISSSLNSNPAFPVLVVFFLTLIIQFYLVRLADLDAFYRLCLISCILVAILSKNTIEVIIAICMLFVDPSWVNDFKAHDAFKDKRRIFPDLPVVISPEQKKYFRDTFDRIPSGSRILFQYSGIMSVSKYIYVNVILRRILNESGVSFLPWWNAPYEYPIWFFDFSSLLDENKNVSKCIEMLESGGIGYVIIYSERLVHQLVENEFEVVKTIPSRYFTDISPNLFDEKEFFYLLKSPGLGSIIEPSTIMLEKSNNRMVLHNVDKKSEIRIKYSYDKGWKAKQGNEKINIVPYVNNGLVFMSLKPVTDKPIELRFGRINYIIR